MVHTPQTALLWLFYNQDWTTHTHAVVMTSAAIVPMVAKVPLRQKMKLRANEWLGPGLCRPR